MLFSEINGLTYTYLQTKSFAELRPSHNIDNLINNVHKIMRVDPFIKKMFISAGLNMDNIEDAMNDLEAQYWIDTATWGLTIWESLLAIKISSNNIEIRRSIIEGKIKGGGKANLTLLQSVADSWRNGEITVTFVNGKINVAFSGEYGVPTDIDSLKAALEDIKPAHLAIVYAYNYLLIIDINNVLTITQIETKTLNLFAGGA